MAVGVRQLAARHARAEKIPIGGSVDACMDGVSLYLEKNFENKIEYARLRIGIDYHAYLGVCEFYL